MIAKYWEKNKEKSVKCLLCPHNCIIAENKKGICGVRKNIKGELHTLVYGAIESIAVDPIEKKPLYNFLPGTRTLSLCTVGCNMGCEFCQNASLSQVPKNPGFKIQGEAIKPEKVVALAQEHNCKTIAYTYTEPTIFYELAYDTAELANKQGVKNIFVTNGFTNPKPIKDISSFLDAANIDLKSFSDEFYKKYCKAGLQPVLDTIKLMYKLGIFIELTTLIIPGLNDSDEELSSIVKFIKSISKSIPWHISAFHPDYKMTDKEQTSVDILTKAYNIGKKQGLEYIYLGNIWGHPSNHTYCPKCNKLLIQRKGNSVLFNNLKQAKCPFCNFQLNIVIE